MALATVIRTGLVYTVTLSPRADACLGRWAAETGRSRANVMEDQIQVVLRNKLTDYRTQDGPQLADRYNALAPADKATVDALLGAVVVEPE